MRIFGYKTKEKNNSKVTSYRISMNNKFILLDFGMPLTKDECYSIDAIFISHEHLDHTFGLLDCAQYLKPTCKIFATKTVKMILVGVTKYRKDIKDKEKVIKVLESIEEKLYDETFDYCGINCTLYQSGHTFGSAMVALKGDYSVLYTGDMNYYKKVKVLQYNLKDFQFDYVIIDGTNIINDLSKKQTENSLVISAQNSLKKHHRYEFAARPEKATLLATILATTDELKDVNVSYAPDLTWFLSILESQGYDPFLGNRIKVDYENKNEGIVISNSNTDINKDKKIGLHISNADLKGFISGFMDSTILLGHYDYASYKEIEKEVSPLGIKMIKEGVNNYE